MTGMGDDHALADGAAALRSPTGNAGGSGGKTIGEARGRVAEQVTLSGVMGKDPDSCAEHLLPGIVVRSVAGHDIGRIYLVVSPSAGGRVELSDGLVRSLDKTKRKNLKHVCVLGRAMPASEFEHAMDGEPCMRERDTMIRKMLAAFQNGRSGYCDQKRGQESSGTTGFVSISL